MLMIVGELRGRAFWIKMYGPRQVGQNLCAGDVDLQPVDLCDWKVTFKFSAHSSFKMVKNACTRVYRELVAGVRDLFVCSILALVQSVPYMRPTMASILESAAMQTVKRRDMMRIELLGAIFAHRYSYGLRHCLV